MLRSRAHYLGTVDASDEKAAEAAAVAQFDLSEEQRAHSVGRRFPSDRKGNMMKWREQLNGDCPRHDRSLVDFPLGADRITDKYRQRRQIASSACVRLQSRACGRGV
jgi:hypothetical protein